MHVIELDLLGCNVRITENKGHRDIVPDQITVVVGQLQLVPARRFHAVAEPHRRGILLLQQLAVSPFDCHPIWPIQRSPVPAVEAGNLDRLLLCASLRNKVRQSCGATLASTKHTANRYVYRESPHLSPQILTPTSLQHIVEQRHLLSPTTCF